MRRLGVYVVIRIIYSIMQIIHGILLKCLHNQQRLLLRCKKSTEPFKLHGSAGSLNRSLCLYHCFNFRLRICNIDCALQYVLLSSNAYNIPWQWNKKHIIEFFHTYGLIQLLSIRFFNLNEKISAEFIPPYYPKLFDNISFN